MNFFYIILILILGIVIGITLCFALYFRFLNSKLKNEEISITPTKGELSREELQSMIDEKLELFKNGKLRKENGGEFNYCKTLSIEIWQEIARKFYPKSKHPCYELNVQEILILANNITIRINNLLDKRYFSMIKKVNAAFVISLLDILESPLIKNTVGNKNVRNTVSIPLKVYKIFKITRPSTWIMSLITKFLKYTLRYIYMFVISFVAEESYKIYSKRLFNEELLSSSDFENEEKLELSFKNELKSFIKEDINEKIDDVKHFIHMK